MSAMTNKSIKCCLKNKEKFIHIGIYISVYPKRTNLKVDSPLLSRSEV